MRLTYSAKFGIAISASFNTAPKLFNCSQKAAAPRICNKDRQCGLALVRLNCEMKYLRVLVAIFDHNRIKYSVANKFECRATLASQHHAVSSGPKFVTCFSEEAPKVYIEDVHNSCTSVAALSFRLISCIAVSLNKSPVQRRHPTRHANAETTLPIRKLTGLENLVIIRASVIQGS